MVKVCFRSIVLWCLAASLYTACIPLEDKIVPGIDVTDIRATYYFLDTIRFTAIFTDNNALDSGTITIRRHPESLHSAESWSFRKKIRLNGRRLEPEIEIPIPPYYETGEYMLRITSTDGGGNKGILEQTFILDGDPIPPAFHGAAISLPFQEQPGYYLGCRSQVVEVLGEVTDNLHLKRIGFAWDQQAPNLTFVSAQAIGLSNTLGRAIQVPATVENGTLLNLHLIAIDTFNNQSRKTFQVLVSCDDSRPGIQVELTSPAWVPGQPVFVIQGTPFQLVKGQVTDDQSLSSFEAFFQRKGQPRMSVFQQTFPALTKTVHFSDLGCLCFTLPPKASPGEVWEVILVAHDEVGNVTEMPPIELVVKADEPAWITVTNSFLNDVPTAFSQTTAVKMPRGTYIALQGKAEDMVGIEKVAFFWNSLSAGKQPIHEILTDGRKVVNLHDLITATSFVMPFNAATGSTWALTIEVTDTKGQVTTLAYLFQPV